MGYSQISSVAHACEPKKFSDTEPKGLGGANTVEKMVMVQSWAAAILTKTVTTAALKASNFSTTISRFYCQLTNDRIYTCQEPAAVECAAEDGKNAGKATSKKEAQKKKCEFSTLCLMKSGILVCRFSLKSVVRDVGLTWVGFTGHGFAHPPHCKLIWRPAAVLSKNS